MMEDLDYLLLSKRLNCDSTPPCPQCGPGEQCVLTAPTKDSCAKAICQKSPDAASSTPSSSPGGSSGSNTGAIAGGVVGGIAGIALIVGIFLWRFYYSSKARQQRYNKNGEGDEITSVDAEHGHFEKRYTTASLASVNTSNTRASNIIPIAYIPGVQNRSEDVPPMPDIKTTMYGDQFFSADDILRNSHVSDGVRSSIATDYRGSTAVIDDTMMTAVNVKPTVVNVGSKDQPKVVQRANGNGNGPIQIGSAQAINSARANAHSIRIGKGVGLQNDMIEEEDVDADAPPVPPIPSSVQEGRYSKNSGLDVPFVIESLSDNNSNNSDARSSMTTFKSARSRPQSSAPQSHRNTSIIRDSEYIMEDIPIEAYLYSQQSSNSNSNSNNNNTTNDNDANENQQKNEPTGRPGSPFDDKYTL